MLAHRRNGVKNSSGLLAFLYLMMLLNSVSMLMPAENVPVGQIMVQVIRCQIANSINQKGFRLFVKKYVHEARDSLLETFDTDEFYYTYPSSFNFNSQFATHSNPIAVPFAKNLFDKDDKLLVEIALKDGGTFVRNARLDFERKLFELSSDTNYTMTRSAADLSITLRIWLQCATNFYPPGCTRTCHAEGNWRCNSEGERVCVDGFFGVNCSRACTCDNGGNCTVIGTEPKCDCPGNFHGSRCQHESHPCRRDPKLCQHGDCVMNLTAVCVCYAGFDGENCDSDINECRLFNPCTNGGTCVNTVGSFNCHCPKSFSGDKCHQALGTAQPLGGVFGQDFAVVGVCVGAFAAVMLAMLLLLLLRDRRERRRMQPAAVVANFDTLGGSAKLQFTSVSQHDASAGSEYEYTDEFDNHAYKNNSTTLKQRTFSRKPQQQPPQASATPPALPPRDVSTSNGDDEYLRPI